LKKLIEGVECGETARRILKICIKQVKNKIGNYDNLDQKET
jgi:hypothetical protein